MRSRGAAASASSPLAAIACPAAASANCATRSRFAASASLNRPAGFQSMRGADLDAGALGHLRREAADAGATGAQRIVELLERGAERRNDAGSGDGDAPHARGDQALPAAASAAATCFSRSASVLIAFRSSSDTLHAELLLDLEHELDEAERIDAERVERRRGVEPVGVDRELLRRQLADAPERVHRG